MPTPKEQAAKIAQGMQYHVSYDGEETDPTLPTAHAQEAGKPKYLVFVVSRSCQDPRFSKQYHDKVKEIADATGLELRYFSPYALSDIYKKFNLVEDIEPWSSVVIPGNAEKKNMQSRVDEMIRLGFDSQRAAFSIVDENGKKLVAYPNFNASPAAEEVIETIKTLQNDVAQPQESKARGRG
jgi:hypothetical protein